MINLQKILVPTDFSDHARDALKYAAALASQFNAEVVLCHVVPGADLISQIPPSGEGYFPPNFVESQQKGAVVEGERWLQEAGVANGRVVTPTGTAFVEIVRLAREEDIDLIVIGTHGRGAIAHMLLGSCAEKVVRKAPCPVLTVRHQSHEFKMP